MRENKNRKTLMLLVGMGLFPMFSMLACAENTSSNVTRTICQLSDFRQSVDIENIITLQTGDVGTLRGTPNSGHYWSAIKILKVRNGAKVTFSADPRYVPPGGRGGGSPLALALAYQGVSCPLTTELRAYTLSDDGQTQTLNRGFKYDDATHAFDFDGILFETSTTTKRILAGTETPYTIIAAPRMDLRDFMVSWTNGPTATPVSPDEN